MATYWTFSCNVDATNEPPRSSSASCSRGGATYRASSLPTNSRATQPPSARFSQGWNIASTGISIIAPRTRTSPRASGSGVCSALGHLAMPNGFSLPMVPSPNIFARVVIDSPRPCIDRRYGTDFKSGERSRLQRSPPEENRQ